MVIAISRFSHGEIGVHVWIAFDIVVCPAIIHVRDLFVEANLLVRVVFNASGN